MKSCCSRLSLENIWIWTPLFYLQQLQEVEVVLPRVVEVEGVAEVAVEGEGDDDTTGPQQPT